MLVMFVIYIFCLSGWNVKNKKAVFSHFAECNGHDTRQSDDLRTCLRTCFAECKGHCTRQTSQICRVPRDRHSANITYFAECLAGGTRQSDHLYRVSKSTTLGKARTFAECLTLVLGKAAVMVALAVMATFLYRVLDWHSAKRSLSINCLPSALCRV